MRQELLQEGSPPKRPDDGGLGAAARQRHARIASHGSCNLLAAVAAGGAAADVYVAEAGGAAAAALESACGRASSGGGGAAAATAAAVGRSVGVCPSPKEAELASLRCVPRSAPVSPGQSPRVASGEAAVARQAALPLLAPQGSAHEFFDNW
jgi:hypothetical protein